MTDISIIACIIGLIALLLVEMSANHKPGRRPCNRCLPHRTLHAPRSTPTGG